MDSPLNTEQTFHSTPVNEVLGALNSSASGLSSREAEVRRERYGPNQLQAAPPTSPFKILLDEFKSPLILILIGAAILLFIIAAIGHEAEQNIDAILILAIVAFNASLGFLQNYRAQRGIEALQRMAEPMASFLRDGRTERGRATMLVPGDVVLLEEGDRVPADGRILEAYDVQMDESSLTGESLPVYKGSAPVAPNTNLAERTSMAFMGTTLLRGRGRFLVTNTGMTTQMGRIAQDIQSAEEGPTHFQREVADLGKRITYIIGALISLIAVLQLTVGGFTLLEAFVAGVALAVAAIPEGLPVVLTLSLAFGTRRMLERNALVRSLPVVEIVGSTQVICTDKTGTITEGHMSMRSLSWQGRTLGVTGGAMETIGDFLDGDVPTDQSDNLALLAGGLCNNASYDPETGFTGDPTEVAILVGVRKAGVDLDSWARVDEVPFSSERRMMSVVAERDGKRFVFSKGAPEAIIDRCATLHIDGEPVFLTEDERLGLMEKTAELARQGLRVLALAYKEEPYTSREEIETALVFLGLAGLSDPPRAEARDAMREASSAGIRVVMITGDNSLTASAIAGEVGLAGESLEGRALDGLDEKELDEVVSRVSIFARAEPRHKLQILQTLQAKGNVVVMTGDGVNDAPALKGSDVGISMGIRGTDVARDASDIVLMDDNFSTIIAAVEEGRRVFANIKKFITYLLIGNLAEVLVILVASFFGQLPVTAVQILWINLVTDGIPAIALGIDPAPPGLMGQPPRRQGILSKDTFGLIIAIGVVQTLIILVTFFVGLRLFDLETARTIAFTAFPLQEYAVLAVLRHREGTHLFANRWLVLAVGVSLGLQLALIYSPLNVLFDAVPLGLVHWAMLIGGVIVGYVVSLGVLNLVLRRMGIASEGR